MAVDAGHPGICEYGVSVAIVERIGEGAESAAEDDANRIHSKLPPFGHGSYWARAASSDAGDHSSMPAMQADMKFAMVPAATAFIPRLARVGFARGRERSDAADLDRNRAQVGEAAQRVGRDDEGPRVECLADLAQVDEGHEFVEDQALAEQIADGRAVVILYAEQPRDRREYAAENRLHGTRDPADRGMQCAENAVDQRDQADESDQHRADIQRELQAVGCAARRRIDDVHAGLFHFDFHAACGGRLTDFGHQHFRRASASRARS